MDLADVCFAFSRGEETVFADVMPKGFCWALMAPDLRSSSRRCPLERRGASLERDEQSVIGRRGREATKVAGEEGGRCVALYNVHCWFRFRRKMELSASSLIGRLCAF